MDKPERTAYSVVRTAFTVGATVVVVSIKVFDPRAGGPAPAMGSDPALDGGRVVALSTGTTAVAGRAVGAVQHLGGNVYTVHDL